MPKISNLPAAASLSDGDLVVVATAGAMEAINIPTLTSYVLVGLDYFVDLTTVVSADVGKLAFFGTAPVVKQPPITHANEAYLLPFVAPATNCTDLQNHITNDAVPAYEAQLDLLGTAIANIIATLHAYGLTK